MLRVGAGVAEADDKRAVQNEAVPPPGARPGVGGPILWNDPIAAHLGD